MTITKPTSDAEFPAEEGAPHELVSDLVMRLTETDFPARPDELLAALIRARTRAKVLQLLHGIPRELRFSDLEEFRGYVNRHVQMPPGEEADPHSDGRSGATPQSQDGLVGHSVPGVDGTLDAAAAAAASAEAVAIADGVPPAPSADGARRIDGAAVAEPGLAPGDEATWRLELAQLLGQQCFPARVDDLISDLALAHAPSRLRWRLARAQRGLRFASLDSLIAHLDAQRDGAAPAIPREPF